MPLTLGAPHVGSTCGAFDSAFDFHRRRSFAFSSYASLPVFIHKIDRDVVGAQHAGPLQAKCSQVTSHESQIPLHSARIDPTPVLFLAARKILVLPRARI